MHKFIKKFKFDPFDKLRNHWAMKTLSEASKKNLGLNRPQVAIFAFDYISNEVTLEGRFEEEELQTIFTFLEPFHAQFKLGSALDIGANLGNHSLFFSTYFNAVHSFEPNPKVFDLLAINAKLATNVTAHNLAISDEITQLPMTKTGSNIGEASLLNDWKSNNSISETLVDVMPLDKLGDIVSEVAFMKIDVEGLESKVLAGAVNIIRNQRPVVVFEQHFTDFDKEGESPSIRLLRSMGYFIYPVEKKFSATSILARILYFVRKVFSGTTYEITVSNGASPNNYPAIIAIHQSRLPLFKNEIC